jgi:hypothetical protein
VFGHWLDRNHRHSLRRDLGSLWGNGPCGLHGQQLLIDLVLMLHHGAIGLLKGDPPVAVADARRHLAVNLDVHDLAEAAEVRLEVRLAELTSQITDEKTVMLRGRRIVTLCHDRTDSFAFFIVISAHHHPRKKYKIES